MKIEKDGRYRNPWVIKDDWGGIINDARGYGYKTRFNARRYAAWKGLSAVKWETGDEKAQFWAEHDKLLTDVINHYKAKMNDLDSKKPTDEEIDAEIKAIAKERHGVDIDDDMLDFLAFARCYEMIANRRKSIRADKRWTIYGEFVMSCEMKFGKRWKSGFLKSKGIKVPTSMKIRLEDDITPEEIKLAFPNAVLVEPVSGGWIIFESKAIDKIMNTLDPQTR